MLSLPGLMGLLADQGPKIEQSGINKNLDLSRFRMPQPSSGWESLHHWDFSLKINLLVSFCILAYKNKVSSAWNLTGPLGRKQSRRSLGSEGKWGKGEMEQEEESEERRGIWTWLEIPHQRPCYFLCTGCPSTRAVPFPSVVVVSKI